MQYTVIGSNVNLASRLSDAVESGQIFASQRSYFRVQHLVEGRAVGSPEVQGMSHPVEVVSILGFRLVPAGSDGQVQPLTETGPLDDIITRIVEDGSYRAWVISNPELAFAGSPLEPQEAAVAYQIATLKGYPLFSNVPAAEIVLLTRLVSLETYREGVVITKQGDRESKFFVIYRGEALVLITEDRGQEQHVATLGRGNYFGELAMLFDRPRNATIRAGGQLELLALDATSFQTLLRKCPVLGSYIEQEARRRLAG